MLIIKGGQLEERLSRKRQWCTWPRLSRIAPCTNYQVLCVPEQSTEHFGYFGYLNKVPSTVCTWTKYRALFLPAPSTEYQVPSKNYQVPSHWTCIAWKTLQIPSSQFTILSHRNRWMRNSCRDKYKYYAKTNTNTIVRNIWMGHLLQMVEEDAGQISLMQRTALQAMGLDANWWRVSWSRRRSGEAVVQIQIQCKYKYGYSANTNTKRVQIQLQIQMQCNGARYKLMKSKQEKGERHLDKTLMLALPHPSNQCHPRMMLILVVKDPVLYVFRFLFKAQRSAFAKGPKILPKLPGFVSCFQF